MFREIENDRIDLEAMFNASPNAYVIFDTEINIVGCNDAYLRETGRERDQIIGRPLFDAFPSDPESPGGSLLRASLRRVLEDKRADEIALIPYDVSQPGEEPEMRYWSATHTPIFDTAGELKYILQHTSDVTEYEELRRSARANQGSARILDRAAAVQAENELLAEQAEHLRQLFEQSPSFMAVLEGPDHVFTLANPSYMRLVGEGRDILNRPVAEALPEVIEQGFQTLLDKVRQTGDAFVGRGVHVTLEPAPGKPAEDFFLDFIYQPIRDRDGSIRGIFVQGHDITEQKTAERALRQRTELLHMAQEAGGIGTFTWDAQSATIAGSATFNALHGLPESDGVHAEGEYLTHIHPDDRESWRRRLELCSDDTHAEYRVVNADGDITWVELQGTHAAESPVSGANLILIGVCFDITQRKERETTMGLIAQESVHRIKNLLSIVQALVLQTLTPPRQYERERMALSERLSSLSKTQELLFWNQDFVGDLREVILSVIKPLLPDEKRYAVQGPAIRVGYKTATGISLAIHELATNALKYGAFRETGGTVSIDWRYEPDGSLEWMWVEQGGPTVDAPEHKGFGSTLIERSWPAGSDVAVEYRPDGLACTVRIPSPTRLE